MGPNPTRLRPTYEEQIRTQTRRQRKGLVKAQEDGQPDAEERGLRGDDTA